MASDDRPAYGPILVTGGDSAYFPMVQEQHGSIRAASSGPPPPLGVIDAGLTADEVRRLKANGVIVVRPQDLPDFPAVQDIAGGNHKLSLRYGHFQRTAINTRAIG
jgi:hypothetical protein